MNMLRFKLIGAFVLGLVAVAFAPSKASATVTFELNHEFSGATAPSGTAPWLRAEFTTSGNNVTLTLTSLLQSSTEFVSQWYFNFGPNPGNATAVNSLQFAFVSGTAATSISQSVDGLQADGDGRFDFRFNFDTAQGGNRFTQGDTAVYTISSSLGPITEGDFNFFSAPAGGHGPFQSAAHVQGINGTDSGWIAPNGAVIPEPSTIAMALTAIVPLGFAGLRRLRRRPDVNSA